MASKLAVISLITLLEVATAVIALQESPDDVQTINAMLDRVTAVGEPNFDPTRKLEPGYLENYKKEQHALYQKKAAVLLELCQLYPQDSRVPEWMNRRWVLLGWNQQPQAVAAEVLADIREVLPSETNPAVIVHAKYWRAFYAAHQHAGHSDRMLAVVDEFTREYPDDDRGAELLDLVAQDASADRAARLAQLQRLAKDYPDTHYGRYAPGAVRRIQQLDQPFVLAFQDAATGTMVDIEQFRDKVVVIDFWATTCVPCIAQLPELGKLYEEYRPKGLEIIGVSLDEPEDIGGRTALLRMIAERQIPWAQYYQGNGYESEFSQSWGVGSAPAMFILDKKGRLRCTEAHQNLEQWIVRLLKE